MIIDYENHPDRSLPELLNIYDPKKMYVIVDDILEDEDSFRVIYQALIDIMKYGFTKTEIRHRNINFKFHKKDKKTYSMWITKFIENMLCWYPFMVIGNSDMLGEQHIVDLSQFNTVHHIAEYIEDNAFPYFEGTFHEKNALVDEIWYHFTSIAKAFGPLMGLGISVYTFVKLEKEVQEIHDLMYCTVDPTAQPNEIEQQLGDKANRLYEILAQRDSDLKPLLVSGKNISMGQFKEMFIKIGLKSDISGNTIPYLLDTNLFIHGLNRPSYQYIEAGSARKALILQKKAMGEPGAFSKRINSLATSPGVLRKDDEFCNSTYGVEYIIHDEKWLELLDKRYYYDEMGKLHLLDEKKDKHLIGKQIRFASPCTCSSKEGICRKCYGTLFDINKDLASVGSYAATKASEPMGQRVLSAKHYQGTSSTTISFQEDFNDIFELNSTEIALSDNPSNDDELYLLLDEVNVEQNDDVNYYYVHDFKVVDKKGQTVYNIKEDHDSNIYLSDRLTRYYRKMRNKRQPIPFDAIIDDDDSVVFQVEIKNKELTGPIKMIERVLSKDNTSKKTLSEICRDLAGSFIDIGIMINLVHIEVILKGLIRKKSNILEYPDWSLNGDPNDVTVLTLSSGLKNNGSALVSLHYGYMRQALISPELYEKKDPSHLDPLFVSNLNQYLVESDDDDDDDPMNGTYFLD